MAAHTHLPTYLSGRWSVTAFKDSLEAAMKDDRTCTALKMYFYAVTNSGWDQIRMSVLKWKRAVKDRHITLIVGTDHAITDPSALKWIHDDGIEVRLMIDYQGVFHPKVLWLQGENNHIVWVGSNNLTRDGLLNNVEFAILVKSKTVPKDLRQWTQSVESGSTLLTQELLDSYESQRNDFESQRARSKATTFTWRQKSEPKKGTKVTPVVAGDLIVEVMPKETGSDGRQLQLPIAAAAAFFDLNAVGATRSVNLRTKSSSSSRTLRMTVFSNNTVRLSISDLDYRDRPCVIVFHKRTKKNIEYEIVPESIFPRRYSALLALCANQTRAGSRRWGIA